MKLKKGYVFVFKHPRRFHPTQLPEPKTVRRRYHFVKYIYPMLRFVIGV